MANETKKRIGFFEVIVLAIILTIVSLKWCFKKLKEMPKNVARGLKNLCISILLIFSIGIIILLRNMAGTSWMAYLLDGALLLFCLMGCGRVFWYLVTYLFMPQMPWSTLAENISLPDKVENFIRKNIPQGTQDGGFTLLINRLINYGRDIGRQYIEEVLLRLNIVFLSVQYVFWIIFLILTFAGIFDLAHLIMPAVFAYSEGTPGVLDFCLYSFDIVTTSVISGISPAHIFTKGISVFLMSSAFFSLILFIPLMFVAYERSVALCAEVRKMRQSHLVAGLSEFLAMKAGIDCDDVEKLLKGELDADKSAELQTQIDKSLGISTGQSQSTGGDTKNNGSHDK